MISPLPSTPPALLERSGISIKEFSHYGASPSKLTSLLGLWKLLVGPPMTDLLRIMGCASTTRGRLLAGVALSGKLAGDGYTGRPFLLSQMTEAALLMLYKAW